MEISKTYNSKSIEKKWYDFWISKKYFTPDIKKDEKPYTILIPPPNVTGILHMGHVLNNTLQDVMIRYQRMKGIPTLWLPGVDHAGIATQNMVEKDLAKEGRTRHDVGRDDFVELAWKWKKNKGGHIIEQLKQLGASCDWTRERFTLDEGLSKAVKTVFISLYKKNLIYKGKYIINWCPRCTTALANDEVDHCEESGRLWHIKYPLKDSRDFITVATTRPETMLGDTAVAVNPRDKRTRHLIGKIVLLPIIERELPVIADDYVDMEFGTGFVKVTPAHDPNDFEIGKRHDLPQITVMDEKGMMNENAGKDFSGMDRYECRKKLVERLTQLDLMEKIDKHQLSVGHCYRCDTIVEPYLSDQWFVKMKPLAEKAIEVVERGEVRFQPERWTKVYMHWMKNIRDWCISRQIWWGHRIPAYYCSACEHMTVDYLEPDQCEKCGNNSFKQDEDVLDTWFSSWLWPFSTMGWPDKTDDLDYFLPTNLLITAPEIIYLWVARMIMATLEFTGKIPFNTVLLHGTVRDEAGRKMSKSLGNSPDPLDIIDQYGADSLRFSMIFNSPKGADSYYSEAILDNGRNFANKIWNAYRFIFMGVEKINGLPDINQLEMQLADKWIYSRMNQVVKDVRFNYEELRFNDAAQLIMDFFWKDFCSWYLEIVKEIIYQDYPAKNKLTVKYILFDVLQTSMRMLHPVMPFITEEIWQQVKKVFPMREEALVIAKFPSQDEDLINIQINRDMQLIQDLISAIRSLRKEVNIPMSSQVKIYLKVSNEKQVELFEVYRGYFAKLAKVSHLTVKMLIEKPKQSISAVVQDVEIFMPVLGLIKIDSEVLRLQKHISKIEKDITILDRKLSNQDFLNKAKPEVVEKERNRYEELSVTLKKNKTILNDLKN